MSLPYFEGDFWPNVIEDCIKNAEKEENERKKHEEATLGDDDDEDSLQQMGETSKKNKYNFIFSKLIARIIYMIVSEKMWYIAHYLPALEGE